MSKKSVKVRQRSRHSYTQTFREETVRMLWDGHCATSVCERLGISSPNLVDRWKKQILNQQPPSARLRGAVCAGTRSRTKASGPGWEVLTNAMSILGRHQ